MKKIFGIALVVIYYPFYLMGDIIYKSCEWFISAVDEGVDYFRKRNEDRS